MSEELNVESKRKDKEKKPHSKFYKYLVKGKFIIKDSDCFKDNIPPQIFERKEIDDFYRELSIFINYRKPNNILLKGHPGSGKTVTINFVNEMLKKEEKQDIDVFIINCYGKTSYDILRDLTDGEARTTIRDSTEYFLKNLKKDSIIFLDEIDRSNKIDDLLYLLSRPKEVYDNFNKNINLVLVSNNFAWQDSLVTKIRSSLQLKDVIFQPYKSNEIKNIIYQRIKPGFINPASISAELIETISNRVAIERRGDCRLALDIIFYAASEAEREKQQEISIKHVEKALSLAVNYRDKQIVSKLKDDQLLTLLAVCYNNVKSLEDLHKRYSSIVTNNKLAIKIKGKVMIFHFLNHLDDLGLVDKKINFVVEKNLQRRSLNVKCRINRNIVLDELNIRGLQLTENYEKQQGSA